MGNTLSIKKISFKDMQEILYNKNYYIINTLSLDNQSCLIKNTINPNDEVNIINNFMKTNKNINIILYGINNNDETLIKKYDQLISLGFKNIYIYIGGLFEWLLLQDIYGFDQFPTTSIVADILKYSSKKILN